MPDFSEFFIKNKGNPIQYKGKTLVMNDEFPISNGDKLLITFEKKNSEWNQGVCVRLNGYIEFQNKKTDKGIRFWENYATNPIEITVWDTKPKPKKRIQPRKGHILVYNVWDTGDGVIHSGHFGSAMIVEEIEKGRRYWCNDGHPDDNFDDIVFRIERIT